MIIAMTGRKRSGKTAAATWLYEHYNFAHYAFAWPMKDVCELVFGWDYEHIEDHKDRVDPQWGISPRKALQTLGTEWGQHELSRHEEFANTTGRMLWVRRFTRGIYHDGCNWVISDCRFPHEVAGLRELDTPVIVVRVERDATLQLDAHESETLSDTIRADYIIGNNGTLAELYQAVDAVMVKIMARGLV